MAPSDKKDKDELDVSDLEKVVGVTEKHQAAEASVING